MYLGRYTYILCIFKRVITNSHRFSFNCSWRSSSCSHLYTSNSHTCRSIGACWQFANHYLHCLILSRHKQLLLFLCAAYLHFVAFSTARVPCADVCFFYDHDHVLHDRLFLCAAVRVLLARFRVMSFLMIFLSFTIDFCVVCGLFLTPRSLLFKLKLQLKFRLTLLLRRLKRKRHFRCCV